MIGWYDTGPPHATTGPTRGDMMILTRLVRAMVVLSGVVLLACGGGDGKKDDGTDGDARTRLVRGT